MPTLAGRFFLGTDTTGYRWGSAATDAGTAVAARWVSERLASAGVGGEIVLYAVNPVVTYTGAVTLRFTAMMDDAAFDTVAVEVDLPQPTTAQPAIWQEEIGFSRPNLQGGLDQGRFAVRGERMQVQVDVVSAIADDATGQPGVVKLDGLELIYEIVSRSRPAIPSPVL